MQDKLVSIILPVYNGEKYLEESINSVLNQTYKNIELIIVNDNSSDSTLSIAEVFKQKDNRVKVITNKTNLKLPMSLNIGFANANGEYYTWTSDDNFYNLNAIEEMVSYLESHPNDAMVCADFIKLNEKTNKIEVLNLNVSPQNMINSNCVGACFLYRKSVANLVGEYNKNKFLVEDYDYWLRIMLKGDIGHISKTLYTYRIHNESLTGTRMNEILLKTKQIQAEYYPIYKKKFKNISLNKEKKKGSFLEQILYEKKNEKKKIVRVLGIKFKYSKKNIENMDNIKQYNSRLTKEEWAKLYNEKQINDLVNSINNKKYSVQTKNLLEIIPKGSSTLEIGSGTGQSSLALTQQNCNCTILDFAEECLNLSLMAAEKLNLKIKTICIDATKDLPFKEKQFDYIFHSGLLEHFNKPERIAMLKHWKKYCKYMISLVPNASCLAYRIGKKIMEENGTWGYGIENPLYTQIDDFQQAGYKVEKEYTIGIKHALNFLDNKHPLRISLENAIKNKEIQEDFMQGYLLVTIGKNNSL